MLFILLDLNNSMFKDLEAILKAFLKCVCMGPRIQVKKNVKKEIKF